MKTLHVLVIGLVLGAASLAGADVIPIDPFVGEMSETFEDGLPAGTYPEVPLFEGNAILDDTLSGIAVITDWWSGTGGELLAYDGTLFGGTPTGSQVITFSTPVLKFGGYMATVCDVPGAAVVFRDDQGGMIAELSATIETISWRWQGWESDTPISSIELTGRGDFGNRPIQFDNLEVTFVPEPGALCLVAVGAGLLLRRRR